MGLERYYQAVDFLAAHSVEQEGFHAGQILDMYEEAVEKGGWPEGFLFSLNGLLRPILLRSRVEAGRRIWPGSS